MTIEQQQQHQRAPLAPADFRNWITRDMWMLFEAAHLLHGFEPVASDQFHPTDRDTQPRDSDAYRVADMYERIKSAEVAGKLKCSDPLSIGGQPGPTRRGRVDPMELLSWARAKGFALPAELDALREEPKTITHTREKTLLRVIGALLETIDGKTCPQRHPDFADQKALIAHLRAKYDNVPRGFSESSLQKAFAQGNAALEDD